MCCEKQYWDSCILCIVSSMVTSYKTVAYCHNQDDISFNYLLTDLFQIFPVFLLSCASVRVYMSLCVCLKFENLHSPDMSGLHSQVNSWIVMYSHRLPLLEWGGLGVGDRLNHSSNSMYLLSVCYSQLSVKSLSYF